jgi:hypothetical protein
VHDLRQAGRTPAAQSGATLRALLTSAWHSSPRVAVLDRQTAADRAAAVDVAVGSG